MCQDGCISTLCCPRWVHLTAKVKIRHRHTSQTNTHYTIKTHTYNPCTHVHTHTYTTPNVYITHIYTKHKPSDTHTTQLDIRNLTFNILGYIMQVSSTPLSQTLLNINSCNNPVRYLMCYRI